MIRTIVVDDEPYLRKSIKTSIENTNANFQVIAEAGNGMQAYNLIKELQPDVVFLDIRMPVMDGISLLDKLYEENICPIRVILSGYSEFEYAKKAIQYNVFDYVLKPIHLEQLTELLSNIADRILKKKLNEEYEFLNYTFKGIKSSVSPDILALSMRYYKEYYCFYLVAGSYMYTKNNQFNPIKDFKDSTELLSELSCFCSENEQLWSISGENQNEMLLIVGKKSIEKSSAKTFAYHIYEVSCKLSLPITLVYSSVGCTLDSIKETVINLKYASIWNIRFSRSALIEWKDTPDINQNTAFLSSENIEELKKSAHEKRYHDFKHSVKHFMDSFNKKKLYQHQLKIELIRILEILHGNYLSLEIQDFVDESISNTHSYEDITEVLMQYIDDYSKDYYSTLSLEEPAELIRSYIDEHYASQLTLKEITTHFHISPSYLSTIFKKAYAVSPNEYIMNKRITKAKDLLSVFPPISIKQIAIMIGYTDPFYFSRIFKMTTGQTPTDYREIKTTH